jgi:hypothetical protein
VVALPQTVRRSVELRPRLGKILLGCGVVSSVLYVATDIVASRRYEGYSYADQQISELLAEGAPSRPFMVALNLIPYGLLVVAFAVGVWVATGRTRAGRMTVVMLIGFAVVGVLGGGVFEMDRREVMAAGADTLRGTLHLPATAVMSLFVFLAMGFGSRLLGKRFRFFSYGTIATALASGLLVSTQAGRLAANEPTPWMGIEERVSSYSMMLWMAALAVALLRAQSATAPRQLEQPLVTPCRMQPLPQ